MYLDLQRETVSKSNKYVSKSLLKEVVLFNTEHQLGTRVEGIYAAYENLTILIRWL